MHIFKAARTLRARRVHHVNPLQLAEAQAAFWRAMFFVMVGNAIFVIALCGMLLADRAG